jgi:hypothetical protein
MSRTATLTAAPPNCQPWAESDRQLLPESRGARLRVTGAAGPYFKDGAGNLLQHVDSDFWPQFNPTASARSRDAPFSASPWGCDAPLLSRHERASRTASTRAHFGLR